MYTSTFIPLPFHYSPKNSLLILSVSLDTHYHHIIRRHPGSLLPILNSHSAHTELSSPISSSPAIARGIRISFRRSFPRTQALDALSKKDISEIRSFSRPPPKVEMVMEAVMILKTSEPSWAESKRQLADVNFLNTVRNIAVAPLARDIAASPCTRNARLQLRNFDKDHISDRTLRAISRYTSNPEFDAEKVGAVSIAAKSLCIWVIAMEKYGKLFR